MFYDRLQEALIAGGFDLFVETACQPYYAFEDGRAVVAAGRYFRMHMVGYFEGIASERGIAWRCSVSMSRRDFLRLENRADVPDHSWLSKTRGRLPREVHERVRSQGARRWARARPKRCLKLPMRQSGVRGAPGLCRAGKEPLRHRDWGQKDSLIEWYTPIINRTVTGRQRNYRLRPGIVSAF
jgi:hypothetical protein